MALTLGKLLERVSDGSVTRVSHKSVLQGCSARVSYKSECHTRCPTSSARVHKSVPQRLPKRMRPTRVHKSVSECQELFGCLFSSTCFQVRVCTRVRGFHLVNFVAGGRHADSSNRACSHRVKLELEDWKKSMMAQSKDWKSLRNASRLYTRPDVSCVLLQRCHHL